MSRLRQAMTEASAETLDVSVEAPAAGVEARLARAAGAADRRDDARGRCGRGGRADRRGAARTGSSGELMGDVLVYVDPSVNDRLLAFARPLADAAGGALVALVASGEPIDADAARGGGRGARGVAPRALPLPPGSAPGGARGGDRGARAGPRPAREHHGRLRPRRRGGSRGGPSLRRLLHRPVAGGRGGAVDQRDLRRAAAGHGAHVAAGGVRDQLGGAARRAAGRRPGRARPARAACRAGQPADDVRRVGRAGRTRAWT